MVLAALPVAKKKNKQEAADELSALNRTGKAQKEAQATIKRQVMTVAKIAGIALVVIWALAIGFWSGLDNTIPLFVAASLTVGLGVLAFLVQRNLGRSEELGALLSEDSDLSPEERDARLKKLDESVDKGDAGAIIAKAQLQMQQEPRDALTTLEKANLEKAPKLLAGQIRGMRAMIHLNLGEAQAARPLADAIDLSKAPDPKSRANLAGVVAEAWARSGNPIEASELLDKYNPEDKDFEDVKVQLLRARVFAAVHKNDLPTMKKALKGLAEVSPQLMALFVGQKRIHPLLQQEAKKVLEQSGFVPRQMVKGVRR